MSLLNEQNYPALSKPMEWGAVTSIFALTESFDETKVSNVSIVPAVGDKYVIMQIVNGGWELPGGTLNAGENYLDALKREVMEELGAELVSYHIFGQFRCKSSAAEPYKPHIPHPDFVRLVGYGEVQLTGQPLNPPDGEQVTAVVAVDIEEAVRRFQDIGRFDLAELYKIAHALKGQAFD